MYEDVLRIENRSERDPRSFCESESDLESDFAETARITFTSVLCCVVLHFSAVFYCIVCLCCILHLLPGAIVCIVV